MRIQLVAFPQAGVMSCPGTAAVLEQALAAGVEVLGGIDPTTLDGDACSGVRYIRGGCEISSRKTPEESWQWRIEMESHCAWCNQGAVRNRLI